MFDFFKKNNKLDAKGIRDTFLQFIKEELQQLDGGEGSSLAVIAVAVAPAEEERFLYEAALYNGNTEKLQEDIQRIADNFALDLPSNWKLTLEFADELPAGMIRTNEIKAGLRLIMSAAGAATADAVVLNARLKILKGKAEQEEYVLHAGDTRRINMGREARVQAKDGSFRINHIAFPEDPVYETNKYISRQHAHIEWDTAAAAFKLYADEGGLPPGNKTKIRTARDESVYKLNSTQIGYPLKDTDQIILGDVAVLEFTINS
ncbi:FHA domain-containing protein [Pedobacter hartonius]|uniref:FHA domain-containing protein n=1 Tax=Pedobacter hartonius TaxID=425514 RepID=A0A1H4AYH9_9SPHI|nr:FHA domain-containing protein [Pedobacter hartonius]SEA40965.1 hypothetical protein SAMN05443550_103138 [Pedobacter hartonius]